MQVRDIMTTDPLTVTADTPYRDLVEKMVDAGVSSLPVVTATGKVVGIVTEADLISKEAYGGHRRRALALLADVLSVREHQWVTKAIGQTAADVMTERVVTCDPEQDIRAAAREMLESGVKRLPVVDSDGILIGVVSRQDVLAFFDREDEDIAAEVDEALHGPDLPEDFHVRFAVSAGVVTLDGDVRYRWDRPIVESTVMGVPGVIDVVSNLHHRDNSPRPPFVRPVL